MLWYWHHNSLRVVLLLGFHEWQPFAKLLFQLIYLHNWHWHHNVIVLQWFPYCNQERLEERRSPFDWEVFDWILPARYNGVHLWVPTSRFISNRRMDSSGCWLRCLTITLTVSRFLLSTAWCKIVIPILQFQSIELWTTGSFYLFDPHWRYSHHCPEASHRLY